MTSLNQKQLSEKGFMNTLRNLLRDDKGDTPMQMMIGAFIAIMLIVPTMTFFTNFLTQTSTTAVDGERAKDLRSWAIDEFEAKPWNKVLAEYDANKIIKGDVQSKFNFSIRYAIDNVSGAGGYVVKLVAPRAGVNQSACNDPRGNKNNLCLYYQYTKNPTLSEGLVPAWSGMNYGQADIQPANGTYSPSLAITGNRIVNIGSFDGCSALTPDRLRVTFKWTGTNDIRPGSVQHLVIGQKLYETIPLNSTSTDPSIWYAATINKPQPSLCFNDELVRIMIDNGARGTISDVYVAPLLGKNGNQHDGGADAPDANLPHIASDPSWATDGTKWYLTFQNPLTGAEVASYQIRGTGTKANCVTGTQSINKGNANNGVDTVFSLGNFTSIEDLKSKVCDRYFIVSVGTNQYNSIEVSYMTEGINGIKNVDGSGGQVAPAAPTNGRFVTDNINWYLKFDQTNIATVKHFVVQEYGTNPQCVNTRERTVAANSTRNVLALGAFANITALKSATCSTFKVTAYGTNGIVGAPTVFTTANMTTGTY